MERYQTSVVLDPEVGSHLSISSSELGGSNSIRLPILKVGERYVIDAQGTLGESREVTAKGVVENGMITLNVTAKKRDTARETFYPDTLVDVKSVPIS